MAIINCAKRFICPGGGMADAMDSKSIDRKVMRVRLPPRAQEKCYNKIMRNRELMEAPDGEGNLESRASTPEALRSLPIEALSNSLYEKVKDTSRNGVMETLADGKEYMAAVKEANEQLPGILKDFVNKFDNPKTRERAIAELNELLRVYLQDDMNRRVSLYTKSKNTGDRTFGTNLYELELEKYQERRGSGLSKNSHPIIEGER